MPRSTRLPIRSPGLAPSNVDLVADALRQAIVAGHVKPGERIKEIPLADQLGVSRGPIREAIQLLAHDGLLRVVANKGAVVPEVTVDDLLEVYALRAALGSLALHKLMLAIDGPPVAVLEKELRRFERAVERGRGPQAADADLRYQSAIVTSAGLPRVARQFDQLTWQVRIFISTLGIRYEDKLPQMLSEVDALHRAIVDRDGVLAEQLWREKFERWVSDFVGQLAEDFNGELWTALTLGTGGTYAPTT
jgi:DNA-binding GntR family transcriptional regulator